MREQTAYEDLLLAWNFKALVALCFWLSRLASQQGMLIEEPASPPPVLLLLRMLTL